MSDILGKHLFKTTQNVSKVIKEGAVEYFKSLPKDEQRKLETLEIINFELKIIFACIFAHINRTHHIVTEKKDISREDFIMFFDVFKEMLEETIKGYLKEFDKINGKKKH